MPVATEKLIRGDERLAPADAVRRPAPDGRPDHGADVGRRQDDG
jgi:hypothetical protein